MLAALNQALIILTLTLTLGSHRSPELLKQDLYLVTSLTFSLFLSQLCLIQYNIP
jgi:hypothetical protein